MRFWRSEQIVRKKMKKTQMMNKMKNKSSKLKLIRPREVTVETKTKSRARVFNLDIHKGK